MIKNERQYKITKRALDKFRRAIRDFDLAEAASRIGSDVLARAELQALKSQEETLTNQITEFEELRSGAYTSFTARSLSELPDLLIRARIARNLTQRELAARIGVKEQQIQRYESSDYEQASLRRLKEIATALDLNISEIAEFGPGPVADTTALSGELDWTRFPIREMYRRQWFEGFSGTLAEAIAQADTLVSDYVQSVLGKPVSSHYRRSIRSDTSSDLYSLLAWQCRVLRQAEVEDIKGLFSHRKLSWEWLTTLARLSSEEDGPVRARSMLRDVGIALVIEPHLPRTYLDGAALLHGSIPVIAMTLRYDRLDNFWFVLFHELVHVMKHLRKGQTKFIFDDLDASSERDIEREADTLAGESLLPSSVWDQALARYVRTVESIRALASELGISPAIIAGRIRRESGNYMILTELVGQGDVRSQFEETQFGI